MSDVGSVSVKAFTSPNFNRGLLTIAKKRLVSRSPQILKEIKRYMFSRVRYEIMNHPVIKSLSGDYAGRKDGSDLPAEYGLTDQAANDGVKLIEEVIVDPTKMKASSFVGESRRGSAALNISLQWLDPKYIQEIIFDPRGYYVSEKSGETIPWAYWMLSEFGEPVTSEDFGILYTNRSNSRSGRAVMADSSRAIGFPYEAPTILVSYNGKNWIEDTIGSIEFEEEIKKELKEVIRKNIASINRITNA